MNRGSNSGSYTTVNTSLTPEELDHHISEVVGTLRKWEQMSPEEQAFAHLSGEGYTPEILEHMRKYVNAMLDHVKYGNNTWTPQPPDK